MLLLHQIILYVSEKLQYDINREAAKTSALSSEKNDKYEYLAGEEILPYNQRQIREWAKFAYSSLGKAFEKQIKTIEDQGIKKFEALKSLKQEENHKQKSIEGLFPKEMRTNTIKNEKDEIEK